MSSDYSASPGPSSRRSARSPSPSYYSSSRRDRDSHDRMRSPSSRHYSDKRKRESSHRDYDSRHSSRSRSRRSRSRSGSGLRSQTYKQKPSSGRQYLAQYYDDLQSLHCKECNLSFNDRESMIGHLTGKEHLKQLRRLKDDEMRNKTGKSLNDNLVPSLPKNFWNENKGTRKLRPEQERFLDTERLDNVPAKFDRERYDNGQYKFNEKEMYCEDCDVWVRSRDQMQAHKEGKKHKKKSAKVQRFRCPLCLIVVPCQDTLNNHMRGKDHIKRVKQLAEQRKQRGDYNDENDIDSGYKVGPMEMAKIKEDTDEKNKRLMLENKNLQLKLKEYQEKLRKCIREHGNVEDYKKYKQYYLENHIRPEQFARGGLHVKKEEPLDSASSSREVKKEPHVKSEKRRVESEYIEEEDDMY